uniref:Dynein heavy chain tail domain-containing protein n=1 Tax=Poecilia latipinna TaxID=48699 RepID=A0A3B3UDU7_9TELE
LWPPSLSDSPCPLSHSRVPPGAPAPCARPSSRFANCTSCLVQATYRKEREERRKLLTSSHKYMFEVIANELSLTPSAVEEFVLDSPSLAAFDHFFAAGGCKTISFVYQESDPPGLICFSVIDATEGLLKGLRNAYGFLLQILETQDSWGALDQSKHGEKTKKIFMDNFKHFLGSLDGRIFFLFSVFALNYGDIFYFRHDQVLTEDDQLRKIDAEGPLSELEYWKKKHLKFSSIVNHMKSEECNAVVMVLHIRRSKMIKVWRDLDKRITDRVNESKDYLKFLSTLEKVLQALYNNDPVCIFNLVNAVELVHSVPLFRNINEKMPSLLIKVTNQLVTACRAHITDHGKSLIWDQDAEQLMRKMQVTVTLILLIVCACIALA